MNSILFAQDRLIKQSFHRVKLLITQPNMGGRRRRRMNEGMNEFILETWTGTKTLTLKIVRDAMLLYS